MDALVEQVVLRLRGIARAGAHAGVRGDSGAPAATSPLDRAVLAERAATLDPDDLRAFVGALLHANGDDD